MRYCWSLVLLAAALPAAAADVEVVKDVAYYAGPGADANRHKLDLYLPAEAAKAPVIVFVHGGGWAMGSKNFYMPGLRAADHGRFFAERGIAAVFVNYRLSNRLSPDVHHPDHVTDVARAIAWTRRNIARYGGDPDRLFLMGHSAGGHLVALVATDPQYLAAEGLTPAMIKGVIPVSGVFTLTADVGPAAGGTDGKEGGVAMLFRQAFGDDVAMHRSASPIRHVRAGLPPFLIAYADLDLPTLAGQGEMFQEALAAKGVTARKMLLTKRSHLTILKNTVDPDDPLGEAILAFIRTGRP